MSTKKKSQSSIQCKTARRQKQTTSTTVLERPTEVEQQNSTDQPAIEGWILV